MLFEFSAPPKSNLVFIKKITYLHKRRRVYCCVLRNIVAHNFVNAKNNTRFKINRILNARAKSKNCSIRSFRNLDFHLFDTTDTPLFPYAVAPFTVLFPGYTDRTATTINNILQDY